MIVALSVAVVVLGVLTVTGWRHYHTTRERNTWLIKELAILRREVSTTYRELRDKELLLTHIQHARVRPTLEDEFAKSAMQTLLETQRVVPGTLDMTLEKIADESYRIARFMLQASAFQKV